ncbi:MAG: pyridoxal phosphate-dependent aminotransferase [Bacteriovoracaceae bacterium]|jgi:aspartate/methionine/tyrosine aminotransferase|nr:pyridoxal phosphate-dependent aminotransferase [Bacteriovoracaceae bacterium]
MDYFSSIEPKFNFGNLPYVDFAYENYPNAVFDLASSNVKSYPLSSIEVDPKHLDMHPANMHKILNRQLASIYKVEENRVAVTIGCTHALFIASTLFDFIYSESPGFEPLWQTPKALGTNTSFIERENVDGRFVFNLEKIKESTLETNSALIITNPHNPSGTLLSEDELFELSSILKEKDVFLVVDEIYLDFHKSLGEGTAYGSNDNILILSGLTKVYGLGALRCGWLIGEALIIEKINAAILQTVGSHSSVAMSYISSALTNLNELRAYQIDRVAGRMDFLCEQLEKVSDTSFYRPEVGIVGLLDVRNVLKGKSDHEMVCELLASTKTIVAPGSFFRLEGHFRVSIGGEEQGFKTGVNHLVRFLRG